ncbi:MAG: omega-amidase [Patescibacteria group bacterium]|jgi:omega-amidase
MQNLTITTVQADLIWENKKDNLEQFDLKLQSLQEKTDLIILPEMFTTGFSMNANAMAEPMEGPAIKWMAEKAKALGTVITGSLIIKEKDQFFNRLIWMSPDGSIQHYDKRHLFTLAKEHKTYTAGNKKLIISYKGWKICPLVCYDLRFPAWSRNQEDYDLLFYVANWPKPRAHHWKSLLMARAIENQSYVVGVNRVGVDEKNNSYTGDTSVIDYKGSLRYQVSESSDVFTTTLSYEEQKKFRAKLNFLPDRDDIYFK